VRTQKAAPHSSTDMTYSTNMPIREFQKTDIDVVHKLIYHTLHTSYTPVYSPQAIKFFKEFHSHDKIMKRYRKGKILVLEKDGNFIGPDDLKF